MLLKALHGEKMLFERLYDIAIEEAKRIGKVSDKKMFVISKTLLKATSGLVEWSVKRET